MIPETEREGMMKSKKKVFCIMLLSVVLSMTMGIATFAAAESTRDWDEHTGSGYGTAHYTALEDGYSDIVVAGGFGVASSVALDVSKPIVISYNTRLNDSAENWFWHALVETLAEARTISSAIQDTATESGLKFLMSHHNTDQRSFNGVHTLNRGFTYDFSDFPFASLSTQMESKCGNNYVAGKRVELEIYFHPDTAASGWVLMDGILIGRPTIKQSDIQNGTLYYLMRAWSSTRLEIKVSQKDVYALPAYKITKNIDSDSDFSLDICRANEGDTITFTAAPKTPLTYQVKEISVNGEAPTRNGDNYSFTMPAQNVIIKVESEVNPDARLITKIENSANISIIGGANVGDTVNFTVSAAKTYKVNSVKVDGVEQTLTDNNTYSFTMPDKDITVEATAALYASDPGEVTVSSADKNGWDTEAPAYGHKDYGILVDANGSSLFTERNGYSSFVVNHSGSVTNVNKLDITKPIYLDLITTPNGEVPGTMPWFMISLMDDFRASVQEGPEVYNRHTGYERCVVGFNYSDYTSSTSAFGSFGTGTVDDAAIATLTNKMGIAWDGSKPELWNPNKDNYAHFEFYFGVDAADSYIKIDGVKVATPSAKQSDFIEGKAYLHLSSFYSAKIDAKVYQDATFTVGTISNYAEVDFPDLENFNNVKALDEIKFSITCDEGYGVASVTAGGKEIKLSDDGYYYYLVSFGTSSLNVETGALFTVTFNTDGGSAVNQMQVANGAKISEPSCSKTGYTLKWYSDSAKTQLFNFSSEITGTTTIYAGWTAIKYTITYYDDTNKLRDMAVNDYNIETATFNLETPIKEGYKFVGWKDADGNKVTQIVKGSTGNLTLYAEFTVKAEEKGCKTSVNVYSVLLASFLLIASAALVFGLRKKQNS